MDEGLHWNYTICPDTLEMFASSRYNDLREKGVHRQAARLIAILEKEKRQELARSVGAYAALLAKLEWRDLGEFGVSLRLVLDDGPPELATRYIHEFEPLPTLAELDPLLS